MKFHNRTDISSEQWTSLKKQLLHGQFTEKGLATHNEEFSLQSLKLLEYFGIKTKIVSMYIQQKKMYYYNLFLPLLTVKPSISTYSKLHTRPHTRLLKCFVLIILCCKTKHLRSLVQGIIQSFE